MVFEIESKEFNNGVIQASPVKKDEIGDLHHENKKIESTIGG